jgi:hypothetical protein
MRSFLWGARAVLAAGGLLGCLDASRSRPLTAPVAVRVTSADSLRSVRFAVHVVGGPAELQAPGMRAGATDARLTASTPAAIVLRPGVEAAEFRVLAGAGALEVAATAPGMRLWGDGARVRLASTQRGVEVRTY